MPSSDSPSSSVRSNFALVRVAASGASVRPGSRSAAPSRFCQANMTWNSGLWDRLRTGLSRSTTCSNGRSWCACADSVRSRTRSSSAATEGWPDRSIGSASVLTKKPIRSSVSPRARFALGEPITTCSWPDRRDSTSAQAASSVM